MILYDQERTKQRMERKGREDKGERSICEIEGKREVYWVTEAIVQTVWVEGIVGHCWDQNGLFRDPNGLIIRNVQRKVQFAVSIRQSLAAFEVAISVDW